MPEPLSLLDSDEERLFKSAEMLRKHGSDVHLWTRFVAQRLEDAAEALAAARMPDAERRAIVEAVLGFKGGQKKCDACGCWNLVDAIAQHIEQGHYRLGDDLKPLPMVLHCPYCATQHVDAPEPENGWSNPPHRTHRCHGCKKTWRPANVPTVEVQKLEVA